MVQTKMKSGNQLLQKSVLIWRIVQTLLWLVGLVILFCLVFYPKIGIHLFWNILIPIAPLLLVVGVGVWRNVCPLASTALLPRHMGFSKKKKLTAKQSGKLNLIAVIALFVIVPLRHAIFDTNGPATALLILSLGVIAVILGLVYEWKSAWCSGLCPIQPVERLYGQKSKFSVSNAHCGSCHNCVVPCPDSTPGINPMSSKKTRYHRITGLLMVGAFPGFVWGWFQVPDYREILNWEQLLTVYKLPMLGFLVSLLLFVILRRFCKEKTMIAVFSATAVSCYYWFRIPALFGFGIFPGDGMLIDLSRIAPEWSMTLIVTVLTLFFFWWLVLSKQKRISWSVRPVYADNVLKSRRYFQNRK